MNRAEIVAELKRVAALLGKESVSRSEFRRYGRVDAGLVERTFGSWNKAVEAAGLVPIDTFKRLGDRELEEEFRRVYMKLGKVPTRNEFAIESQHTPTIYEKRFGSWRKVLARYLGAEAAGAPPRERAPKKSLRVTGARQASSGRPAVHAARGGQLFGAPLKFRALLHEPVNEQGVVFLFGMVAAELGFVIDAIQTGFPDCRAKRRIKGGRLEEVRVEFEFKSRTFRDYHDPSQCDLIVCWEHDWPDCPVEVLELKSAIRELDANV